MQSKDPLQEYCKTCPSFDAAGRASLDDSDAETTKGCKLMVPPEDAGQRLLLQCPIPPQLLLERIVQAQLRRNQAEGESQSLCFEVKTAFAGLSPKNFGHASAGARLVVSLLQSLAWRRYAAYLQETQGRLQPSSCQWFQGIRGTGSFCRRETPAVAIDNPQACVKRECFAPFRTVALPEEEEPADAAHREGSIEQQQIQLQLGVFIEKSPLLGDLFCQLMEADAAATSAIKARWAARHKVTKRTIENWRDRAASLFFVLYTGAPLASTWPGPRASTSRGAEGLSPGMALDARLDAREWVPRS